jgi:hypothetical protein
LFSPPQQQQQQQQQSNQDAPAPRLCYCDQPSDPDCVECAANRSTPDSIVPALVDDGFIPNVLDTSFMLVLMAERKVPFCGQHFIIPTT